MTPKELEQITRERAELRAKLQGQPVYQACTVCDPRADKLTSFQGIPPPRVLTPGSDFSPDVEPQSPKPAPGPTSKPSKKKSAAATPPSGARFLLLPEVAAACRVPLGTVRHWIREGKLRAIKPGRRIMVARAELERLLRES